MHNDLHVSCDSSGGWDLAIVMVSGQYQRRAPLEVRPKSYAVLHAQTCSHVHTKQRPRHVSLHVLVLQTVRRGHVHNCSSTYAVHQLTYFSGPAAQVARVALPVHSSFL